MFHARPEKLTVPVNDIRSEEFLKDGRKSHPARLQVLPKPAGVGVIN
jgi:hypothetical protein